MCPCLTYIDDVLVRRVELHQRLLALILELHSWATNRPEHETSVTGNALMEEAAAIMGIEQEQGRWSPSPSLGFFGMQVSSCCAFLLLSFSPSPLVQEAVFGEALNVFARVMLLFSDAHIPTIEASRMRLVEFVSRIKDALATLTNFLV